MKNFKTVITSIMLCMGIASTIVACSEKADEPVLPVAKNLEGVYNGDMTCTVLGTEFVFEDMTFTVSATDDSTVSIAISSFGEPPMTVPAFTINGIKTSGADGTYSLAATDFSGTTDTDNVYSGTIQGDFADNTINITFNLHYGAMPMPMICAFSALKE